MGELGEKDVLLLFLVQMMLNDFARFRTEEVPRRLHDKYRLGNLFEQMNVRLTLSFSILFLEPFLFSSGTKFFYPTKPAKILLNLLISCIKQLLCDGCNIATIKNSLMKSCSPQTLSCISIQ